jgi:hypothetical protein
VSLYGERQGFAYGEGATPPQVRGGIPQPLD